MLTTWRELELFEAEWHTLYRTSASTNPYASPHWLLTWARHCLTERDLAVVVVRREDVLIGVAACYTRRAAGLAHVVRLWGSGAYDGLTELPQVLTAAGEHRSVLRAVLAHWAERVEAWDWLELPLQYEQGWFEPDWLSGHLEGGIIEHKITRPSVVMALPERIEQLRGGLKRNLIESLNRGRNRLGRAEQPWSIRVHRGDEVATSGWPALRRLHQSRSLIAGRRRHPDELADPARQAFLLDALSSMASDDSAQVLTLDVAGTPVAAQTVLYSPAGAYLGVSGVDPAWWHCGPVTLLQLRAAELAIERGRQELNLSCGPSVAKFRWSERVVQHPEFIICGPRPRTKATYCAARAVAAVAAVRREAARHRTTTSRHGRPPTTASAEKGHLQ